MPQAPNSGFYGQAAGASPQFQMPAGGLGGFYGQGTQATPPGSQLTPPRGATSVPAPPPGTLQATATKPYVDPAAGIYVGFGPPDRPKPGPWARMGL